MLFSSLTFLTYFLPAVVLIHYVLPKRAQNAFLLLASLVFYAFGEWRYVPLLLLLLAVSFALPRLMQGKSDRTRKILLVIGLLANFGTLFFFKYAAFLMRLVGLAAYAPDVSLPLGISFFTFQTAAYLIDVYRKNEEPERSFVSFSAFIMLFPQLIAGPILRYGDLKNALHTHRRPDAEALERGATLFIVGLSLKVLLANPMGEVWTELNGASGIMCTLLALFGFSFQIYFDFFGYSLMAKGLGFLFGFPIADNFDMPYAALSPTDFWRRWHMTLSGWFRDYVYIPLGGNRRGKGRQTVNLLIVWALTGIWHGAGFNFPLWGLYWFVLLMADKFLLKGFSEKHRALSHLLTGAAILFGWLLFASDELAFIPDFLTRFVSVGSAQSFLFWLREYALELFVSVAICVPAVVKIIKTVSDRHRFLRVLCCFALLVLCLIRLVTSSYNPFLYFRF